VTVGLLVTAIALGLVTWGVDLPVALAQAPTTPPTQESKPEDPTLDMTSDVELTRAAIQVRRQAIVTAAMDLDAKESQAFWPMYREYREAMAAVNDRLVKLLVTYLSTYENLTDETAGKMLEEFLSIERARNSVKSKYVPRFGKLIPTRKVARFFQVDNKLDAFINADLAQLVPLAR
jgi:hypothetical protein